MQGPWRSHADPSCRQVKAPMTGRVVEESLRLDFPALPVQPPQPDGDGVGLHIDDGPDLSLGEALVAELDQ